MPTLVTVRGVSKSYGMLSVLRDINLTIPDSSVATIVGASGAGKTTLLQILGTMLRPDSGEVTIGDTSIFNLEGNKLSRFRNREIGFVFQFHHLLPEFNALENVCIPALIQGIRFSRIRTRAAELLDFLGLSERIHHKPQQLSGGEQQRVAVARALINQPRIILADEPSGNLDTHNKEELHALFFKLRDEFQQTFVIVTHDPQLAQQADQQIHLADGRIRTP